MEKGTFGDSSKCCCQVILEGDLDFGSLTGPAKHFRTPRLINFTPHPVTFQVLLEGRMPISISPMSGELGPEGSEASAQALQVELRATFPETIQGCVKVLMEGADLQHGPLTLGVLAQVRSLNLQDL